MSPIAGEAVSVGPMRRSLALAAALAVAGLLAPRPAAAQDSLSFVGVALDAETREADARLRDYLRGRAGLGFATQGYRQELEYGEMIDTLVVWSNTGRRFLGRATPYVLVAAEMLGASLEVLATYESHSTESTTYQSYFVVGIDRFPYAPDLNNLETYLRQFEPVSFVYHSKFSTSSYFLPSLFFRSHRIFYTDGDGASSTTSIHSQKLGDSSTNLVKAVADGQRDLAAVWDGTKQKFDRGQSLYERYGSKVHFIPIPTALPNDLLVAPASLDVTIRQAVTNAIRNMPPDQISVGDFVTWREITGSDAARALADLRWLARERPAPVTVQVVGKHGVEEDVLEAVRQAVRLSGTEFVLYDSDFHGRATGDFLWTLEPIHDGAVVLTSEIPGSGLEPQRFQMSFATPQDLTRRTGSIIHSRLHRIRYVWPYKKAQPIVIRDVDFAVPSGARLEVQKISWEDPQKNLYKTEGRAFEVEVEDSDFYKFALDPDDFPIQLGRDDRPEAASFEFDPLSNISYRVVLVRPSQERPIFRALTVLLIVLLVSAAVAAVYLDPRSQPTALGRWFRRVRRRRRLP